MFLSRVSAPQAAAMVVRSLPVNIIERLARDAFDTYATHAGLGYDVTETDCRAQNGSTHGRVFATLKRINK